MAEHPRNGDKNKPHESDHGWKKVQSKRAPAATARAHKMAHNAIDENEGDGVRIRQLGFIVLRFMFQTRKENKIFNLTRSLKYSIASCKAIDKVFSILPLF
jgi:hypothetical protein